MAADAAKSTAITNYDAQPIIVPTTGIGAVGRVFSIHDVVAATAVGLQTSKSSYRLCRFPTKAIPLSLFIATDVALDTGTHALVFDINVAFSDSTTDGTSSANQGLIPTTANTGANTTLASYSSPNVIFGTINNTSAANPYNSTQLLFNGSRTNYPMSTLVMQPLWQTLGFTDGRGNPADPGGYFDLFLVNSTVAGTGAAGNIYARFEYIL